MIPQNVHNSPLHGTYKNQSTATPTSSDLGFTSKESFGLFMEGLRAIQMYSDEADKSQPRHEILLYWIREAEARLRECVAGHPRDPLPRYYLGVALTICNQNSYIQRISDLKGDFIAWGRYTRLNEKIVEAKQRAQASKWERDHATEDLVKLPSEASAAKEASRRAIDLDKEPWPLLRDAEAHFKFLLEHTMKLGEVARNALVRSTTYNLAEVFSRLGRVDAEQDDIKYALNILKNIERPVLLVASRWWPFRREAKPDEEPEPLGGEHALQDAEPESEPLDQEAASPIELTRWESIALELQVKTLSTALKTRHALKKLRLKDEAQANDEDLMELKKQLAKMEQLIDEISKSKHLPAKFKVEVTADYWIKRGYLTFEQALVPVATLGESTDKILTRAEKYLENAINLKPNWNPAQIYLALVFAVHSGVAAVNGESNLQDRFADHADRYLASLLGSQVASAAPPVGWNLHVEGSLRASPEIKKPDAPVKPEVGQA